LKIHKHFQRFEKLIPTILFFSFLLLPLLIYQINPKYFDIYILAFAIWICFISLNSVISSSLGIIRYKKHIKKDWLKECELLIQVENLELPKHLIVLPSYGETYEMLSNTLNSLAKQNYPKEKIFISISLEQRRLKKDPSYAAFLNSLQKDFKGKFFNEIMIFVHPDNLEGEVAGASANRSFGAKQAVEVLKQKGEAISNFLVTSPDSDAVLHPEYLANTSFLWLKDKKTKNKFYQTGIYTFNNNFWHVPNLSKNISLSITMGVLMGSLFKRKVYCFSCYTFSLQLLVDVNYWDVTHAIDDTLFYWRVYEHLNGIWTSEPFYLPVSLSATYHPNYLQNHIDQLHQVIRWTWGIISLPLALKIIFFKKGISLKRRIIDLYNIYEFFIILRALTFLIAIELPLIFLCRSSEVIDLAFNLFGLSSLIIPILIIFKFLLLPQGKSILGKVAFLIIDYPLSLISFIFFWLLSYIYVLALLIIKTNHKNKVKWTNKKDLKTSLQLQS
jgi:cellulose synthase/poly-beta-1,6-N-acetylglucosamine synthase-like glycosyltransferase